METQLVRALVCLAVLSSGVGGATTRPTSPSPGSVSKRTVLLLGDSLIVTSFGEYLEQLLNEHPGLRAVRRAKSSTGLARPDFFDWMAVGREEVERHRPDLVVVIMGGNDGQGLTDAKGKAQVQWGRPEWATAYRQRVEEFLGVIAAPGRKILWVELPLTGLPGFERKLKVIRPLLRDTVSAREDALHLDTKPFFTDAKGGVLREAQVQGFRKAMRLRMDDGVHFTIAGGRYFATRVFPSVVGLLGPGEDPGPASPGPICREPDVASEVPRTSIASGLP
jgi:hypothetical protein